MKRATWFLIAAAVLQAGTLSAPENLKASAVAFVETQTRAAEHRVACQSTHRPVRAERRIIAI